MSEEKTVEKPVPEVEQPNLAQQALTAAAELKVQVEAMKEQNKIASERFALQQLAGKSEAGTPQPVPKEETAKEYTDRIMRNEKE